MNRLNRTLYLLAVAIFAVACGNDGGRHRHLAGPEITINRTWPAAGVNRVRLFETDGSISVEAGATDQITLVAKARGDFEVQKDAENQGLFETRIVGDTLEIGRREPRRFRFDIPFVFGDRERRINYVLQVPQALSLELKTVNGHIATKGGSGETEAVSVNGGIDVETAGTQSLRATTVNGAVRAKFVQDFQGAQFRTVNGGVEATLPQTASFNVDLSQVNGHFEASFPLSIHSNPGSRRVSGEINGGEHELHIVTVNGDVELVRLNGALPAH